MSHAVHKTRLGPSNQKAVNPKGSFVLYWMTTTRRFEYNDGLNHAIALCHKLQKPLVILEAIRLDYPFASARHHSFMMDGMVEHAQICARAGIRYLPYLEDKKGAGRGLLRALSEHACAVVGDLSPGGWLRRASTSAISQSRVAMQLIDSIGIVPMQFPDRLFRRAYDLRRYIARELPQILETAPAKGSLDNEILRHANVPTTVDASYALATSQERLEERTWLTKNKDLSCVAPTSLRGGTRAGHAAWVRFCENGLSRYAEERQHPDAEVESRQAPYLHYGHASPHRLLAELLDTQDHTPASWASDFVSLQRSQESRWGLSPGADGFLDQLLVWRELGQLYAYNHEDFESYDSIPNWAQVSLAEHQHDTREKIYSFDQLEHAQTHDSLWNAAQRQLVQEGHIHNYLRMLWGKRVLAWIQDPRQAYETLVILNHRYALDGRDPNSHAGIGWIFGLFDRPWGPERPIYGKVRYMTTQSTLRKLRLRDYLQRFGGSDSAQTTLSL